MLQRLLWSGVISGMIAGVFVTVVHLAMVTPLIIEAEVFENQKTAQVSQDSEVSKDSTALQDEDEAWSPEDGAERNLFTLLTNILMGVGFGLLLATAMTLSGQSFDPMRGAIWGGAGFLCFSFLPGLGLPPELPAAAAGDLFARQTWWLLTAFGSALGLALIAFNDKWLWRGIAALALLGPHVIGAPHAPAGEIGVAPPELAAHFVMATLFAGAVLWITLGVSAAYIFNRISLEDTVNEVETTD